MAKKTRKSGKGPDAAGPSQRQLRVGELIRHRLAELLARGDVHDDDLQSAMISISEVRMSPDLKLATVYVTLLGDGDVEVLVAALMRNKKFIRGETVRGLGLKFAPDLRFRYDESIDEARRIDAILRQPDVQQDIAKS